jgi:phosphodiesterase/alkaline phosphatase D-like protein
VRGLSVLVAAVVLGVAVVAAHAATGAFQYGVAAGEVTSSSAVLWTRGARTGRIRVRYWSTSPVFDKEELECCVRPWSDQAFSTRIEGLAPGTRYSYQFGYGARGHWTAKSAVGTFETAPGRSTNAAVRFAISGDADATPGTNGKPGFNRFEVYGRMASERNDFNINLGDTIYSDSEVAGAPPALTVPQKWAKYKLGLALPALRTLRASAGLYSHWDDHEFVNDFSQPENGSAIYSAGVKAFADYAPVARPGPLGLYRSFRWGKNLELFFLDERSFRNAKADDACGGDLAPTAPQAVRDAFATLAPGLKTPVSAVCLATLNDPARTMLGAAQYEAFTKAIRSSTATWKVVVNEVPIQQYYALPYDRWEGYAAERDKLLRYLQTNVRNVVFLTTDTHANFVNEVRYRTLGGAPEGSGMWEVVTGPVATNTFAKEIDRFLGQPGAGTAIGALFFKPAPPNGMGMRCAALDTYSYAQVSVTARTLRVALKDARGRPVQEATGTPCAPLVLTAR